MAAKKGFSPNDPYQNGGGMCTTCKLKIPKERLTELTYPADRNGSIRCKECSNQIRFHPRRSGRCRHNGKTFKREESIARY